VTNFSISYQLPSGEVHKLELSPSELVQRLLPDPLNLLVTALIIDAMAGDATGVRIWVPTVDGFAASVEVTSR
jgi:hypothetical protein